MMDDTELGLDSFVKCDGGDRFIAIQTIQGVQAKVQLESKPLAHQRAIVCKGKSCFLGKPAGSDSYQYVVKSAIAITNTVLYWY